MSQDNLKPAAHAAKDASAYRTSTSVASVAGAELPPDATFAGEYLFRQADRALYDAKLAGRDQVAQAEQTVI